MPRVRTTVAVIALALLTRHVAAQSPLRRIASLDVSVQGLSARVDPAAPVLPRNVAAGVRVVLAAGSRELTAAEVVRLYGAGTRLRGELSGPGLPGTLTVPADDEPLSTDA